MVTFVGPIGFDRAMPPMPQPVREAREAALGLAGFGIVYPAVLAATLGGSAAWFGALQFAPGVLLGLVALGFGNGDLRLRRYAMWLAVIQLVVALRVSGLSDLGVIAPLTVLYAWGICCAVLYLLTRPQAREWFGAV